MKITLPPPLTELPHRQSFTQDFGLLLKNQLRVFWNNLRHRPPRAIIAMLIFTLVLLSILVSLGALAYGALKVLSPQTAQGFLSLLFMGGLMGQIFFGITAAFAALYMSEDLETLFVAPVSLKAVFAVKSLSVMASNLLTVFLLAFLPGIFYGLLFQAAAAYYLMVLLVGIGLWVSGTAIAELLNLVVMRIVPPHRSKEAVGFIGALTGILIAVTAQIPRMLVGNGQKFSLDSWLSGHNQLIQVMNYFPWGWGSLALVSGISGDFLSGLGWSVLLLALGVLLFSLAFVLVERGFRRGFISLSQGEGGRRRRRRPAEAGAKKNPPLKSRVLAFNHEVSAGTASPWAGMWAIAKKDLLYLKRDTREWFGYLVPLIIMGVFILQHLFANDRSSRSSLITVLIMYTVMFSGNLALQSFGREGESDWLLNSVPLAGWPVVWGKLTAAVLPTLVLMEALLVGTAVSLGLSPSLIGALVLAAVLLSMGSSAIGLFYSINNSRYNPDSPKQRISPGASLLMYLINFIFILVLGLGLLYLMPPGEFVATLRGLPPVTYQGGIGSGFLYTLYLLSRPLFWAPVIRSLLGILITAGVWSAMFFGFMAATVRQSRKGFRVQLVSRSGRKLGKIR
ncbi:putative ABC transporter permease subunit [Desulfosporosinus sp. SB140]|uniref:putative ABC transporter permease subunit n=1 Tax=Desulfosporosinus paludis TaxID=3115649 RepID=UPI00388E4188